MCCDSLLQHNSYTENAPICLEPIFRTLGSPLLSAAQALRCALHPSNPPASGTRPNTQELTAGQIRVAQARRAIHKGLRQIPDQLPECCAQKPILTRTSRTLASSRVLDEDKMAYPFYQEKWILYIVIVGDFRISHNIMPG